MSGETDSVGEELSVWLADMPKTVVPSVEAVRQRIGRLGRHLDRILVSVADDHDISVGDWAALSAIRRSAHGVCTPKQLAQALAITSGTMSVRIERLLEAGFVEQVEGVDLRSRPVRLTELGVRTWEFATADRTEREAAIVSDVLRGADLTRLNSLLGVLLAGFESGGERVSKHDIP